MSAESPPPLDPKPTPAARWWGWPHMKRFAAGAAKSGAVGVALGALCAFLPEHLTVAKIVCRFAAHFFGG